MQKLLRLNPSSPLLCTCAFSNTSGSLNKLRCGIQPTKMPAMSAAAVFSGGFAGDLMRKSPCPTVSRRFPFRCSVEARVSTPGAGSRAWVVLKEEGRGRGRAWFHTVAEEGGGGGESDEKSEEKSSVKMNRRQKSGGSGGGLVASPDLLTIPGVGPRNLRKLVDNGIGGVAELKQLYKDKV